MKLSLSRACNSAILAALVMTFSVAAQAQDDEVAADPTAEQAQAYIDAQSCAIILKELSADEDKQLAAEALERAKALAPVNGDDSDEKFEKSFADMEMILSGASDEEKQQFVAACRAAE